MTINRKLGIAGLVATIAGWSLILYVQHSASVCGPSMELPAWVILLLSLAAPIAIIWAAIKDKWWWAIGLLPACLLMLTWMGTFEGC